MHKRDVLKIKAIRSNDPQDWITFKKMRNSANCAIFRAKQTYLKNSFNDNKDNPKNLEISLMNFLLRIGKALTLVKLI